MPPLLSSPSLPVRVLAAAIAAALLYYSSHSFRRGTQPQGGTLHSPGAAGDDQPSADYVASPNPMRAVGPKPDDRWRAIVDTMTAEVQAADAGEGFELVFYGDSITETWRGTDLGKPCKRPGCKEGAAVFRHHFGDQWRAGVLGVAADQTGHLLWRLRNGHTPAAAKAPKAAVVLIGTNDLGHASEAGVADPSSFAANALVRIHAIVEHLRKALPPTKLVLLGVLPRGWRGPTHFGVRPEKGLWYDWPNPFTPGIEAINAALKDLAKADKQVEYLDCSAPFLSGGQVMESLMPDALHPNGSGMEEWAKCMDPVLKSLLGPPGKAAAAA